jgi:hypothetical protein
MGRSALFPGRDIAGGGAYDPSDGSDAESFVASVEGHLDSGNGRSQASHGGAAAFIEATTTGVTEVLLEHLTRFEGFGAILDDRFTLAMDTVHWYCWST